MPRRIDPFRASPRGSSQYYFLTVVPLFDILEFMNKVLVIGSGGGLTDGSPGYECLFDRGDTRLFTAATAEEGLRIHREEKVNLLVTELDLPDMGGDVLCSRIRRDQALRNVSVVIVCGNVPEEIRRAEGCGANRYLLKPVEPEQLDECVGKLLSVPARRDGRFLVRAQVYGVRGTSTLFCTSRNISVSGILLECDCLLAVGDRVSCMFFLPGSRQIKAVGVVVRTIRTSRVTSQFGIRFVSLYPQAQAEIAEFVSARVAA